MDYWHEVVLIPAVADTDALGTLKQAPGSDGPTVLAVVQQTNSTELTTSGQQTDTNWTVFLPPDAAIDGFGYLRFGALLLEVDGEPAMRDGPDGPHHLEARLRKVR